MQYEIQSKGTPKSMLKASGEIVHGFDPNLPLEDPTTLREQFDHSISRERLVARLSSAFAGLAMFLVVIGIYGTVSYMVNRRTVEIGLRMVLGASRREVLGMVLRESILLALVGIGIHRERYGEAARPSVLSQHSRRVMDYITQRLHPVGQ